MSRLLQHLHLLFRHLLGILIGRCRLSPLRQAHTSTNTLELPNYYASLQERKLQTFIGKIDGETKKTGNPRFAGQKQDFPFCLFCFFCGRLLLVNGAGFGFSEWRVVTFLEMGGWWILVFISW